MAKIKTYITDKEWSALLSSADLLFDIASSADLKPARRIQGDAAALMRIFKRAKKEKFKI